MSVRVCEGDGNNIDVIYMAFGNDPLPRARFMPVHDALEMQTWLSGNVAVVWFSPCRARLPCTKALVTCQRRGCAGPGAMEVSDQTLRVGTNNGEPEPQDEGRHAAV